MEYTFANRVAGLKPSAIREILKFTSQPGYIPFSAGNPAPDAFPVDDIARLSAKLFETHPIDALQYSITEGYGPLRTHLMSYMKEKHNVGRDFDDILITTGANQVMELTAKVLCNEGDTVICENPSFIGSLNAFRSYGVKLRGVEMEADGMDMNALEQALQEEKRARFIYTIPNFQNPTGVTMSYEKRRQLYALAKKYGVLILEDNPYGDTRFAGEDVPCIKSLDEDGLVIYCGSFSKVMAPGMRVGYAIAPGPVFSKLVVCKQVVDVHTNIWSQIVAHGFMTECDYDGHLKKNQALYGKTARSTMDLMDKHLAPYISYQPIEGGLFLWCRLPDGVDMNAFCKEAVNRKVATVPGSAFLMDENEPCQCFRINYSTPTDQQIAQGMEILGRLAAETCGR